MSSPNALRWQGRPGHYEVYYLTLTDPATGVGFWIRYTLLAPDEGAPSCTLWFLAMDPGQGVVARKTTFPISELSAEPDPFRLQLGPGTLADGAAQGELEDAAWSLRWDPGRHYEHVPRALQPLASTIVCLPHGDVAFDGQIRYRGRVIKLAGARGAQAHLWGSEHAARWAWARCAEFRTEDGERVTDTFIDGLAAKVRRFGREVGPLTLLTGRIDGRDFRCTSLRRPGGFGPEGWRLKARAAGRELALDVRADRRLLAGVTYHDPDGQTAYCYNSEAASMSVEVRERGGRARTLLGDGFAHFEYAQREPLPGLELHLR